jgi:hypothetical protein
LVDDLASQKARPSGDEDAFVTEIKRCSSHEKYPSEQRWWLKTQEMVDVSYAK